MLSYLLLGAGFSFAAVVQPGPLQAWLMAQAVRNGWRRTLPAAFSPLLSDGPIIVIAVVVLSRIPGWLTAWLRAAGGIFVLYLAYGAYRSWRTFQPKTAAAPSSLLRATVVNFLNPNPWLSWSLVLGPLLVKAWRESPSHAAALLGGFYGVIVAGLSGMIVLFGMAGRWRPGFARTLIGISAAMLAAFGLYLLLSGLK